ncbi:MAG TPA: hypothetical protein DCR78_06655 [Pseudomonas sp.]|jgi:hypothetical protein|nr:hypothetical protein [Stutzerimonas xanthomarina]HAQ86104.1 hypothetical protein [Pseudomonas sp.]
MITAPLVILLIVIGWSAAALAMLWGMLRVARHHHKPSADSRLGQNRPRASESHSAHVSLSA